MGRFNGEIMGAKQKQLVFRSYCQTAFMGVFLMNIGG
jgi:hypothetical protein